AAPARPSLPRRALSGLWNGIVRLAEYGPMMDEVRKLNRLSDEALAARGTTREAEVRRIFGPRMGL
ncbi:MAG TPA: hypothetical protein PKC84_01100, partial [Paracoccaceae bacterium]|nr:hypothetical protein [Paracoccaceae bacterium]